MFTLSGVIFGETSVRLLGEDDVEYQVDEGLIPLLSH